MRCQVRVPLPCAVKNAAKLIVASDEAIGDGHVLCGPQIAEREAGLRANTIILRRIDGAVRYAHILAAVDVHAVPVGIDIEVVDGEVINSGKQKTEVASL